MTTREEWLSTWPRHCPHCRGAGIITWQENAAPLGSGKRWMMDMMEECQCVGAGRCPLCGEQGALKAIPDNVAYDSLECTSCGWNSDRPDVCPPEVEDYDD